MQSRRGNTVHNPSRSALVVLACVFVLLGLVGITVDGELDSPQAGEELDAIEAWLILAFGLFLMWTGFRAGITRRGDHLVIRRVGRTVRIPVDGVRVVTGQDTTFQGLTVNCPILIMPDGSDVPLSEFGRYPILDRGRRKTIRLVARIARLLE